MEKAHKQHRQNTTTGQKNTTVQRKTKSRDKTQLSQQGTKCAQTKHNNSTYTGQKLHPHVQRARIQLERL